MLCFSTLCFRWLFNSSFLSLEQNDASIPFRQSVSHTFKPHPKACCNASILSNRYPPKYAGSSELIVTMIPWSKNCGIGEWTIDGMRCSLTFESGHTVRGIFRRANSWHRSISSIDRIPWSTRWTLRWPITARTYWGGPSSPACAHFKPHCLLQRITAKSSREGAVTPQNPVQSQLSLPTRNTSPIRRTPWVRRIRLRAVRNRLWDRLRSRTIASPALTPQ